MLGQEKSDSISTVKRRNLTSDPRESNAWWSESNLGQNPQKIKEVEVTPSQKDSLIPFMKTLMKEDPTSSKRSKKKGKSKVTMPEDPIPVPPTPSKKNKNKWRRKNKTSSTATTYPGMDETTSTWSGMEKGPAFRTLNQELAWGRFLPLSQLYPFICFQ